MVDILEDEEDVQFSDGRTRRSTFSSSLCLICPPFIQKMGLRRSFPVTTSLERTLIIVVAIAVTVSIGLIIVNHEYRRKLNAKDENICYSASCVSEASNLIQSMDLTVDPCTDFYSFVCGNWIKNNYLVSSVKTQFTKLSQTIFLRVKTILEDLENQKHLPENKRKIRDFFKACMNKAHRDAMGADELITDLKKFGGWPIIEENWKTDFDWSDLVIQLFKSGYINNMLFTTRVGVDIKNTSRSLLTVGAPSLGVRREYFTYDLINTLGYKDVILKLALNLNKDINVENATKDIEEAIQIENKLARISNDISMRHPENLYNLRTVEDLQTTTPKIPWKKLLENLLPKGTEITNNEQIVIMDPSMIKSLNSLLEDMDNPNGKRILANYMFYRVVFSAARYLSEKFYSLATSLSETDRAVFAQPWQMCAEMTLDFFPIPLASSYIEMYVDHNTKKNLGMMLQDMRLSLRDGIKSAKWLDERTKRFALQKVEKMRAAMAYKDEIMDDNNLDSYFKDVNITEDYFENVKHLIAFRLKKTMDGLHEKRIGFKWTDVKNLLTANAYYLPTENSIIVPVGVLQGTFFATGRPNYINYGSLGMVMGHELTHAFDSIGSFYDSEGNYRMWWSGQSWRNFKAKIKCYEKQYSKYYMAAVHSYVNGTLTLSENIADNGGLKTAYYAYKTLLKRTGSEKSLPGLPYNEKQMFWISFASVWCRKQTAESILYSLRHSVHTPSKFRVIGSLSNMKEFSEDFGCKSYSPMNPFSKCSLWE